MLVTYVKSEPHTPTSELDKPTLVWDWKRGEIIDVTTGEVVDRIYVYDIPMREEDHGLVPDLNILTPADELHPLHLPHSSYVLLEDILNMFVRLKNVLPIPCSVYVFEDTVRKLLKSVRKVRGLRKEEMLAAFIYLALEEINIPVDMYELSKILDIPHSKLKSAILHVKTVTGKSTSSFDERTRKNIISYGKKLKLDPKIVSEALDVYEKTKITGRYTPRTIALAILYIVTKRNNQSTKPINSVISSTKVKEVAKYICGNYRICWDVE